MSAELIERAAKACGWTLRFSTSDPDRYYAANAKSLADFMAEGDNLSDSGLLVLINRLLMAGWVLCNNSDQYFSWTPERGARSISETLAIATLCAHAFAFPVEDEVAA